MHGSRAPAIVDGQPPASLWRERAGCAVLLPYAPVFTLSPISLSLYLSLSLSFPFGRQVGCWGYAESDTFASAFLAGLRTTAYTGQQEEG